jgi:hypothetical protein
MMAYEVKQLIVVEAANAADEAAAYADHPDDTVLVIRTDLLAQADPGGDPPPDPTYEDLTTYTEVDPGLLISVSATALTATSLRRNVSEYVCKDFGADYFTGDFEIDFEIKALGYSAQYAGCTVVTLNNAATDYQANLAALGSSAGVMLAANPTPAVCVQEVAAGVPHSSAFYALAIGTTYYMRLRRVGSVLSLLIYSDAARTTLLTTLSLTLQAAPAFRFLHAVQSINSGHALAISASIGNIAL